MRRALELLRTLAVGSVFLLVVGAGIDCGGSKQAIGSGGSAGSGGERQGYGGSAGGGNGGSRDGSYGGGTDGSGGAIATGGTVVASSQGGGGGLGTGSVLMGGGTGGSSTGMLKGGTGGSSTGMLKGGTGGSGNLGTGGMLKGGTAASSSLGTGGMLKGGTGGSSAGGAGGATALDGGATDAPPKCADVTTQAECEARTDCHSVFEDPGTCGCTGSGCCAHFRSCAAGAEAKCMGTAACTMPTPFCEPPYVVAYTSVCYEGCVHQDDCDILPCPKAAPTNGSACGSRNRLCYYEDCVGAGRSLATCTAGSWQVQAQACAPFTCQDVPGAAALTCAAGQVCVITTDSSFNVKPACEAHTCGTGPMSTSCIEGIGSNWCMSPKYDVEGLEVRCGVPVP